MARQPINFTLIAPNGTRYNFTNSSSSNDFTNASFNLTSYGTWKWNVSAFDSDGVIVNMSGTGEIILMELTENLNATIVTASSPVAVSGHINLSDSTNVTTNPVNIFVNDVPQNGTGILIDDNHADFSLGTFNNMKTQGSGVSANLTSSSMNISGSFASKIFDGIISTNWTNISISTEAAYGMEIGRSTGDNVGDGFSITDDSLVALADGSKKKIKDVKEGDYVKSLDEKSGKIVSRKVNALLDHGIKPTFEMETEDGRSINTTAEHPYLVKLYDKESCNKYADTFWNKIDKKENEDLNKFDENGYCTRWVEVSELKEGMEIAVPALQNKPFDFKNSTSSSVVNTLTKDCFLKCGSLDQIGHLSIDNDKARYSVSSISSINEPALSMNFSNFDLLTTLMVPSNLSTRKSISFTGKDEINSILGLCFLNSSNKNSGANKSSLSENNRLFVTPLPINPVNSILASTSSSMNGAIYFNPGYSFLYLSCNPLLTALPNSSAPFSVILDLATIELNSLYSAAFSDIAFRAISDQFNSGMASISSFNSLGIAKVNVGIFNPPLAFNTSNYVYNVQIYKPFGYDTSGFSDRAGIGEKEGNNGDLEGQLFYVDLEKIDSQENQENKKSLKQAETVFAESFNNNNKYLNICDADTENIEKCKGSEMRVSSYELAHMSQAQWIERLSHSREDAGSNFINAP